MSFPCISALKHQFQWNVIYFSQVFVHTLLLDLWNLSSVGVISGVQLQSALPGFHSEQSVTLSVKSPTPN